MDNSDASTEPVTDAVTPQSWIGVDLDGTLAKFSDWQGIAHIGKPVPEMMARVRRWRAEGLTVKIFTARAAHPEYLPPIRKWLKKHKLGDMEITNELDEHLLELWDDRAVQVITNTAQIYRHASVMSRPKAPLLEEAFPHENRPKLSFSPED